MSPPAAAELDRDATPSREQAPQRLLAIWQRVRSLESATALLLLASLWLATRPYSGMIHDARIYLVQGLSHLYPGAFADDLFFKFGSQDGFSIFGPLLA